MRTTCVFWGGAGEGVDVTILVTIIFHKMLTYTELFVLRFKKDKLPSLLHLLALTRSVVETGCTKSEDVSYHLFVVTVRLRTRFFFLSSKTTPDAQPTNSPFGTKTEHWHTQLQWQRCLEESDKTKCRHIWYKRVLNTLWPLSNKCCAKGFQGKGLEAHDL